MFRKLFVTIIGLVVLLLAFKFARAKGFLNGSIFTKIDEAISQNISLPWNKNQSLSLNKINISSENLNNLEEDGIYQAKILTEKAKNVGDVAQDFVGEIVQTDASDSTQGVSERIIEYGRYVYCQEVVKQYETNKKASF